MTGLGRVHAVLFDMDGTLLDSEYLTEAAVEAALAGAGIALPGLDLRRFHGINWRAAAAILRDLAPPLAGRPLETDLEVHYRRALLEAPPAVIPGAPAAVVAAARRCRTALVTSSDHESAAHVVARLGLETPLAARICGEDCARGKPDPEPYRRGAERLGVDPARCLVFEDSLAGIQSARAAGMRVIAILPGATPDDPRAALAERAIPDYTALPAGFFDAMGAP